MSNPRPEILPGDLLGYWTSDPIDWIITLKTWTFLAHVEVYDGAGKSVAARWAGVNRYPFRRKGLMYVLRPNDRGGHFDRDKANAWFCGVQGQAYDLLGLLVFTLAVRRGNNRKMFCSEFATRYYRAGGFHPFATDYDADRIAPAQFLQSASFETIWRAK